jgi:hypothetical protein
MSLAEDQHPVDDFATDGQDKALGEAVRPRTARWDLDHLDTGVCQDRVERRRELTGAIPDEEPEPGGAVAEVRDEVAGLLGGPGSVGMSGDAQDVEVAVADLEGEQDVEPPQRERAVDVEEIHREHAGGLGAQELPPTGVGVPQRRRWDPVTLEDPPDRRGTHAQLTLEPDEAPARVLPRPPHHQGDQGVVDR